MGPYEIIDPRFGSLIARVALLEKLDSSSRWAEGPVWFADQRCLIWSDIPNERQLKWDEETASVSVFQSHLPCPNGSTRDTLGRLTTCMHGSRSVVRTEFNGELKVLAAEYNGKRLNSPNDVVVKSDGSIWFTDPAYGITLNYVGYPAPQEQDLRNVFRIDPDTLAVTAVASEMQMPNGLAFSPDESILYVAESGWLHDQTAPHQILAFPVEGDRLGPSRVLADITPGVPDGLRVDVNGNLWVSAADGVHCLTPDGTLIGKILVPEIVSNLAFGGRQNSRLFITASTSLYSVFLNTTGLEYPFNDKP